MSGPLEKNVRAKAIFAAFLTMCSAFAAVTSSEAAAKPKADKTPLIYCTDLFHPPDDPDDWFDLATLFAIGKFDIRGIILDQGDKQKQRSGRIPIEQMMSITAKKTFPSVYGLPRKLQSPSDKALDQPQDLQVGVELILSVLKKSDKKVTLIAVGSLRDVCAAYNREPELLKEKVERLYVVAGHSDGGEEYNVKLDPHAYVGVMRSGLPLYWLPCFGREPHVCRWQFTQGEVLENCPLEVHNYFVYGLTRADPKTRDAILALGEPIAQDVKQKIWAMDRAMWSTAAFIHAAGLAVVKMEGQWRLVAAEEMGQAKPAFRFVPRRVAVNEEGVTRLNGDGSRATGKVMQVFQFEGTENDYNAAMRDSLTRLLEGLAR